jgi:hypothetical protein
MTENMTLDDIVLWRRLDWIICTAEEELGLRPDGRAEFEHLEKPMMDRLDEILRAALAMRGRLDPFRYRVAWTIRNLMAKHGATEL